MKTLRIVSTIVLVTLGACRREQPSRVVKLAEDSGAGSLEGVSLPAMRYWLGAHPQVAAKVEALCTPLRSNATAAWPESTEGRLCLAARAVTGQNSVQKQLREHPDHSGFLPGWK